MKRFTPRTEASLAAGIERAAVDLPVSAGRELAEALAAAIADAEAIDHPAQSGSWSEETLRQLAMELKRRRSGR